MKILLTLFLVLTTTVTAGADDEDIVVILHRDAASSYSGIVQLYRPGKSGTVCADDYDDHDARVVCRQFAGYFTDGLAYKHDPEVHTQGYPFITSQYHCKGNESRLSDCPHVNLSRDTECHDTECRSGHDAGVLCFRDGSKCLYNEQPPTATVHIEIVVGSESASVVWPVVVMLMVLILIALHTNNCPDRRRGHRRRGHRRRGHRRGGRKKLPAIWPDQLWITMDTAY